VITTALCVTVAWGVQLGAVDARIEAREEEVVAHQVDQVHVVHLHVAPKGAIGRHLTLDVRVRLPTRQRGANMLGGVADDPSEDVVLVWGRRRGRHGYFFSLYLL
jgi:hypothetical protein